MTRALLIPCAFLLMSCDQKTTSAGESGPNAKAPTEKTPPIPPTVTAETGVPSPTEAFIGMAVQEALEKAKAENRRARIAEEDGVGRMLTRDFIPTRLNFFVKNGHVIRVTQG